MNGRRRAEGQLALVRYDLLLNAKLLLSILVTVYIIGRNIINEKSE